jgi:hypothetical protein
MYNILDYTYAKAKDLNVDVKPSTNPNKKIDVFKNGKKIASIGATGYADFPTYIKSRGLKYALDRRRLYYARHKNEANIKDGKLTASFYAKYLLW